MRGMRLTRSGMDCLVRGTKRGSEVEEGEAGSVASVVLESEGCVVVKEECGAGAVEGRIEGLGSGGSRDVVRRGKAGGPEKTAAGMGAADCTVISSICCVSSCLSSPADGSLFCFCVGEPCCCSPGPS